MKQERRSWAEQLHGLWERWGGGGVTSFIKDELKERGVSEPYDNPFWSKCPKERKRKIISSIMITSLAQLAHTLRSDQKCFK